MMEQTFTYTTESMTTELNKWRISNYSPEPLPYLEQITGNVVGVGFVPGPSEVRIKQEGGPVLLLAANEKQVLTALSLRSNPVTAMILSGKTKKLLWIRSQNAPEIRFSYEQSIQYIEERWGGVLKRLAE